MYFYNNPGSPDSGLFTSKKASLLNFNLIDEKIKEIRVFGSLFSQQDSNPQSFSEIEF